MFSWRNVGELALVGTLGVTVSYKQVTFQPKPELPPHASVPERDQIANGNQTISSTTDVQAGGTTWSWSQAIRSSSR